MDRITYQDTRAAIDAYNTTLEEAGLDTHVIIVFHNGTADLLAVTRDGERTTIAEGLTARGVLATLKMMKRVADMHAARRQDHLGHRREHAVAHAAPQVSNEPSHTPEGTNVRHAPSSCPMRDDNTRASRNNPAQTQGRES